jgi:hypothetical protein
MRPDVLVLLLLLSAAAGADELKTEFGGHTKLRIEALAYPEDSVFTDFVGRQSVDALADMRLTMKARSGRWSFDGAYQLVGMNAETLRFNPLPDDRRRLFDLSHVISQGTESALLHRIDRVSVGYTSEKAVVRLGRQALSWGNGLFYAPMDLVNPFDPASIDTEYKLGDDMLYLQYLRDSGDDVQAAYVARRNLVSGDVDSGEATFAMKYHGFAGEGEYDVLVAESYGDTVMGLGLSRSIGGAVWSADLVLTDTQLDTTAQFVTNLSYSWNWADKNMTGVLEYYFNGFGQQDGQYDTASVALNPDLLNRLLRGELYAVGRHYIAGSIMIEMTPLWMLTPTVLANVGDPSALLQLVTSYSLADNMTLLGSVNVPLGPQGTEFRGIGAVVPGRYLSRDAGVFFQFAWYF